MNSTNPFEVINSELSEIKTLLIELKEQRAQSDGLADYCELLTRKQAAKMVNVAVTTLDRYTNNGLLKKYRNGKMVRFKKSEVLAAFKTFQKWQRL